MCMIVLIKEGGKVDKETLKRCYEGNKDGWGIMYVDDANKLQIRKGLIINDFWNAYDNIVTAYTKTPIVVHFRAGSNVSVDNCHPFRVNDNLGFVHNGFITKTPARDFHSDTYMFNELIMKKLPDDVINNLSIQILIEDYVDGNKLVFMNNQKDIYIINEDDGFWEQEKKVWYSNSGYKVWPVVSRYIQHNYTSYYDDYSYHPEEKKFCYICNCQIFGKEDSVKIVSNNSTKIMCNLCLADAEEYLFKADKVLMDAIKRSEKKEPTDLCNVS